jgi:hypothetical protein
MELFCVFANSEDSLNIFNDNAEGRFRVYFPNPYVLLFFSWVDALHLPCLHLHGLAGPLLSTLRGTRGSQAPHIHRQWGLLRSRRDTMGGISFSKRWSCRIFRFVRTSTGNVSPSLQKRADRQRTAPTQYSPILICLINQSK